MLLETEVAGDVAVITLKGTALSCPEATRMTDTVDRLLGKGVRKVVIDLDGVRWCLAAFLGGLVGIRRQVVLSGGALCLAGRSRALDRMMRHAGLAPHFERAWWPRAEPIGFPFPMPGGLCPPVRF